MYPPFFKSDMVLPFALSVSNGHINTPFDTLRVNGENCCKKSIVLLPAQEAA